MELTMTDQPGLPSAADLDAVNAELAAGRATAPALTQAMLDKAVESAKEESASIPGIAPAKAAHDATIGGITAQPETQGIAQAVADTADALGYIQSKGYSLDEAEAKVKEQGVASILAAKALESTLAQAPQVRQAQAIDPEPVVSRHGEVFNPDIHAQLPTGDPKTDSTGRFISKANDYSPANVQIPGGK